MRRRPHSSSRVNVSSNLLFWFLVIFSVASYANVYSIPSELTDELREVQMNARSPAVVAVLQLASEGSNESDTFRSPWPAGYMQEVLIRSLDEAVVIGTPIEVISHASLQSLGDVPVVFDLTYIQTLARERGVTHLVYFQHKFTDKMDFVERTTRLFEVGTNTVRFTHRDSWSLIDLSLPNGISIVLSQCAQSLNAMTCDLTIDSVLDGDNTLRVNSVYLNSDRWLDVRADFEIKGVMNASREIRIRKDYVVFLSTVSINYTETNSNFDSIGIAVSFSLNNKNYFYLSNSVAYSKLGGFP